MLLCFALQATRWITRAAGRSTSEWTMCPSTGRRRRSRARVSRARKWSRASWRISFRPCSNRQTTSWPWNCSAARRLWWRNGSGKRLQVTGSSILAPVFGESFRHDIKSFHLHGQPDIDRASILRLVGFQLYLRPPLRAFALFSFFLWEIQRLISKLMKHFEFLFTALDLSERSIYNFLIYSF